MGHSTRYKPIAFRDVYAATKTLCAVTRRSGQHDTRSFLRDWRHAAEYYCGARGATQYHLVILDCLVITFRKFARIHLRCIIVHCHPLLAGRPKPDHLPVTYTHYHIAWVAISW